MTANFDPNLAALEVQIGEVRIRAAEAAMTPRERHRCFSSSRRPTAAEELVCDRRCGRFVLRGVEVVLPAGRAAGSAEEFG